MNKYVLGTVAIVIAISVVVAYFQIYSQKEKDKTTSPPPPYSTLPISNLNNDFAVKVAGIPRKLDINETKWQILNSAEELILQGDTYGIYDFGKIGCLANDVSHSKGGYMNYDNGTKINATNSTIYWENFATKCNRTLYSGKSVIVFSNNDESSETDWKISAEDQFFIRGKQNYPSEFKGEKIEVGYLFKLIYKPTNETIANIQLT